MSVHGTGTPGYSYYRQVQWRVGYSPDKVNFNFTPYKTTAIGATTGYVSDTMTAVIPWQTAPSYIRVDYIASDVPGGTQFSVPLQYAYSTASTSAAGPVESIAQAASGASQTNSNTLLLPSYSPPSGWQIYKVTYQYQAAYRLTAATINDYASASGPGFFQSISGPNNASGNINTFANYSTGSGSYSPNALTFTTSVRTGFSTPTSTSLAKADVKIRNGVATIALRQPIGNSSTTNEFAFDSFNYQTVDLSWLPAVINEILD
jgi:hypothetical protein